MRFTCSLSLLFIFICSFFIPNPTYAYSDSAIQLTSNVTGRFVLQSGETVKYVTLFKDQSFLATSINDNEWSIQVGNAKVTVPKRFTTSYDHALLYASPNNKLDVITTTSSLVFSEPKKAATTIASFPKDTRVSTNGRKGNYYEIIIGGQKGYIHKSNVVKDNGVPILIYHHLVKNQSKTIFKDTTSVYDIDLFQQQISYLKAAGFITISLEDLDLWMQRKQSLPGKAVVLTFDDANLSVEKLAYPILKKNHMTATTFVIGNRVKEGIQQFDMLKFQFSGIHELRKMRDVFNLEYHTYAYHEFNSKTGRSIWQDASITDVKLDFNQFKQTLKAVDPDVTPRYFAYPYGKYNKSHESALIQSGISLAFLNKGGKATIASPRLYVPRIPVQAHMSLEQFKNAVNN